MDFINPKTEVKNTIIKDDNGKPKKISMKQIFIISKKKKKYKKK
ncbi:MAG: hypothetical protein RLZZ196_2490 [Bacteroidota bacterium]|jgi:hypothetical protein